MNIRACLQDLVKAGKFQTTAYENWEKRSYDPEMSNLGYENGLVMYDNQKTHMKLYIGFRYGVPSLNFEAKVFSGAEFTQLCHALEEIKSTNESEKSLRWSTRYSTSNSSVIGDTNVNNEEITNLVIDWDDSENIVLLESTLDLISNFISFPTEMLTDIKIEIKRLLPLQEAFMNKLTEDLVNGCEEFTNKNHFDFYIYDMHGSQREAMRWIASLTGEGRLFEALLWCNVFPDKSKEYQRVLEISKVLLMQIQDLAEEGSEFVFPFGDTRNELSYKEALFKVSYKIAAHTDDVDDKKVAVSLLNEISGQANFIHGAELPKFTSADLLIHQAQTLKTISDENKALKEKIQLLESKQAKTSQLGVFSRSADTNNQEHVAGYEFKH